MTSFHCGLESLDASQIGADYDKEVPKPLFGCMLVKSTPKSFLCEPGRGLGAEQALFVAHVTHYSLTAWHNADSPADIIVLIEENL